MGKIVEEGAGSIPCFFIPLNFPFVASFQKPAISTLDGKILDSYFFNAIFLLKCAFKQLQELNFGWVDVEEGAGNFSTNTCLIPSIL